MFDNLALALRFLLSQLDGKKFKMYTELRFPNAGEKLIVLHGHFRCGEAEVKKVSSDGEVIVKLNGELTTYSANCEYGSWQCTSGARKTDQQIIFAVYTGPPGTYDLNCFTLLIPPPTAAMAEYGTGEKKINVAQTTRAD